MSVGLLVFSTSETFKRHKPKSICIQVSSTAYHDRQCKYTIIAMNYASNHHYDK